ncbi:MAG: sugar phosphate isomerase/epimerase [Planctomycetes bacterium]|nr:sugar phosphate isomerase/epimerase [Planctomycetota bacterium]
MGIPEIGVCSWSLKVTSVPELRRLMKDVGAAVTQVALGDPNHATWKEGPGIVKALRASHLEISATMIGYPGEDYATPETIRRTGGFGDPATRKERLEMFRRAVDMTAELGVKVLASHAGFIPEPGHPDRGSFLDCLYEAAEAAARKGITFALETGQEAAELLRRTLDELALESLKVNFDPANMILYDMGDPIHAVEILGPDIAHVHVMDALAPKAPGTWGEEVPLGQGEVGMSEFLEALAAIDYSGPLVVEREVGDQAARVEDIRGGIQLLRKLITGA